MSVYPEVDVSIPGSKSEIVLSENKNNLNSFTNPSVNAEEQTSYNSNPNRSHCRPTTHPAWTSASLNLVDNSAYRYATIPRRRTSKLVPGMSQDYYESFFCGENASVSSLPATAKPNPSYIIGGKEVKASSISHLFSLPPSSLPSIAGDGPDPFLFLNNYDDTPQDRYVYRSSCDTVGECYFLPTVKRDKALEKWKKIESINKYNDFVRDTSKFRKPMCLKAEIMSRKGKTSGGNDLSLWL